MKSEANVEDIADFMNLDDDVRSKLVPLPAAKMEALAAVCNRYPSMDLEIANDAKVRVAFSPESDVALLNVEVSLLRDLDREDFETEQEYRDELKALSEPVQARFYPQKKDETWWIIVGATASDSILSIKRVMLRDKASVTHNVQLEVSRAEMESIDDLKVYAVCDAYLGCDLEKKVEVTVTGI